MDALAAVLSLTAAIPINPGASRRRRRLQESIQECHDGHDGFLVVLSPTALPSPALRAKARRDARVAHANVWQGRLGAPRRAAASRIGK